MGATAAIGWQFTETDFPRAFAQRRQAWQIVFDPLADAVLNGLGIDILGEVRGLLPSTSWKRRSRRAPAASW